VDMKCEGCVNSVRNKLQAVNGMRWLLILNTQSLISIK
jgi:copper chaperone CopZ